jgi:hypothetical protein
MLLKFLAQGISVDTKKVARARLVAGRFFHHNFKHWAFNSAKDHLVNGAGVRAVKIPKILLQIECNGLIDRWLVGSGVWVQHGVKKTRGSIEIGAGAAGRATDKQLIGGRISPISSL